MKKCSRCGNLKNRFHKRAASKDGLQAFCVDCCNGYMRIWRAIQNDKPIPEKDSKTVEIDLDLSSI